MCLYVVSPHHNSFIRVHKGSLMTKGKYVKLMKSMICGGLGEGAQHVKNYAKVTLCRQRTLDK